MFFIRQHSAEHAIIKHQVSVTGIMSMSSLTSHHGCYNYYITV